MTRAKRQRITSITGHRPPEKRIHARVARRDVILEKEAGKLVVVVDPLQIAQHYFVLISHNDFPGLGDVIDVDGAGRCSFTVADIGVGHQHRRGFHRVDPDIQRIHWGLQQLLMQLLQRFNV